MMKKIICIIASLLMSICCALTVPAATTAPRLADNADILSDSEYKSLNDTLNSLSNALDFDIVVYTVDYISMADPIDYTERVYKDAGYNEDGIILLLDMDERECHLLPMGEGRTAIDKDGEDYILDGIVPYLSDDLYSDAFYEFARLSEKFVVQARTDEPYSVDNMPKDPYDPVTSICISLVIALIIALIATGVMKGKLKSVRRQTRASQYVRYGSMNVTNSTDFFLYRSVTRVAKPKDNSSCGSRSSSSGRAGSSRGF